MDAVSTNHIDNLKVQPVIFVVMCNSTIVFYNLDQVKFSLEIEGIAYNRDRD